MAKIKETELGGLLNALAAVLKSQIADTAHEIAEDGTEGEEYYTATPALLTVAARFLKDNGITCAIEDSEDMNDLKAELAKRKKRKGKVVGINHLSYEQILTNGGNG